MNRDLDYVLNYMIKYTQDRYMQDSEPMLNHRDIELVLKHIYEIEQENKQLKETIKEATRILNSAKNHYGNDGKNWALERVIDLLGDKENE